jgi:predicted enzyme related to lactoylglutathione lyase
VFRPLLDAGWKVPPDADEQIARFAPLLDAFMGAADDAPPPGAPAADGPAVRETFLSIGARDMARATAFYGEAVGAVVMYGSPGWSSLRIAGVRLGLFLHPEHPGGRAGLHFVVADLATTRATIERAGGRVAPPVEVAPGVVTVDATDTEGNTFTIRET